MNISNWCNRQWFVVKLINESFLIVRFKWILIMSISLLASYRSNIRFVIWRSLMLFNVGISLIKRAMIWPKIRFLKLNKSTIFILWLETSLLHTPDSKVFDTLRVICWQLLTTKLKWINARWFRVQFKEPY